MFTRDLSIYLSVKLCMNLYLYLWDGTMSSGCESPKSIGLRVLGCSWIRQGAALHLTCELELAVFLSEGYAWIWNKLSQGISRLEIWKDIFPCWTHTFLYLPCLSCMNISMYFLYERLPFWLKQDRRHVHHILQHVFRLSKISLFGCGLSNLHWMQGTSLDASSSDLQSLCHHYCGTVILVKSFYWYCTTRLQQKYHSIIIIIN